MAKTKGKGGVSKTPNFSGGMRRCVRAKRALMRITMKIARWERNQEKPEKVSKWSRKQNPQRRSRHNEWNTEGLKRHVNTLQSIVSQGQKVRA
jgi:hypothetical protein